MGLFSRNSGETSDSEAVVRELVENAESDTVTSELLTSTKTSGILSDGITLKNNPVNYFLEDNEQPHFIFYRNDTPVLQATEVNLDLRLEFEKKPNFVICLTDHRIVLIESSNGRDLAKSIPYTAISKIIGIEDHNRYYELSLQLKTEATDLIQDIFSSFGEQVSDKGNLWNLAMYVSFDSDTGHKSKIDVMRNARDYLRSAIEEATDFYQEPTTTENTESATGSGNPNSENDSEVITDTTTESKSPDNLGPKASDSSAGSAEPSSIEVGISIHSETADTDDWLKNIDGTVATQQKSINHTKVFGSDYVEFIYGFTDIAEVYKENDGLSIGGKQLRFLDILNVRFLEDRDLVAGSNLSVLRGCDYIALTVATDGVSPDQTATDYEGGVSHLYLIGSPKDLRRYAKGSHKSDNEYQVSDAPSASRSDLQTLFDKVRDDVSATSSEVYILQDYIERPSHLKIEGWQESGATKINAGIGGDIESSGKSRGIQVGPYTSARSQSEGSIIAELDGSISDNSFSSEISFLRISRKGIFVDSDPVLNFDYSAIDRVLKRDNGFSIEADGTVYTIVGPRQTSNMLFGKDGLFSSLDSPALEEAIAFIQEQVSQSRENKEPVEESDNKPADKLRELKNLHEEGVLTDDEFKSKKRELLDDF
ncbi:SHOCT domain-containing protein [Natrinema halophilum]|nr:SHOCT domain-containing protein [Natrinema halophilum]UHQ96012.1 SHOCT domain-containing protein [Natrinema halophilum]